MSENYMDYSGDACMNIFTEDQVARIMTVLANSPGRSELPSSTAGQAAAPIVSFGTATSTQLEGTDCNFTDFIIPVTIGQGASQNVTANFTINASGTATATEDFQLITNSVSFNQGATAPQDITLRIFNDAFSEADETVVINFTINNNGGDATIGNNTHTLTITDDDLDPLTSGFTPVFADDFENGLGNWNITGPGSATNFAIANNASFPNSGFFVSDGSNNTNYAFVNDDNCNCDMSAERIATNQIALTAGVTYNIQFDYVFDNRYAPNDEVARIELSNDGGATWFGADLASTANGSEPDAIPFETIGFNYEPTANENVIFSILYNDGGQWGQGFILDNFSITGPGPVGVENIVSGANADTLLLPSSGLVNTYDEATQNIILSIDNTSDFNYGCISSEISRAGNGTQSYNGSTGNNLVANKTFTITPVKHLTNETAMIDFYFTQAELNGLLAGTGLNNTQLFAYREGSNDIVALTPSAFGDNTKLTGTFTGIDGTYYIGSEGAFRTRLAPKMYLSGPTITGGLMSDALRSNGYIPTTSPYSDNLTVNATVFNTTGANAIVDWVWIELRDATTNTTVSAGRSALLQRDGDVVDVDGTSALTLNVTSKNYYVVVNHRNHLAAMSANTLAFSATPITVDFTSGLTTFGTNAQQDMGSGVMALWSGDLNGDGVVRFAGPSNDTNILKSTIVNYSSNSTGSVFFPYLAYDNFDLNMNGQVRFAGPGNDSNILKSIIISFPGNSTGSVFFPINQQLP
jgi:hypothetical protein